jgi:hypothetical protein
MEESHISAMVGRDYVCEDWEQKVIVVRRQPVTTDRDDPRPAVPARE